MSSFKSLPWELKTSVIDKLNVIESLSLLLVGKAVRDRVLKVGPFRKQLSAAKFYFSPERHDNDLQIHFEENWSIMYLISPIYQDHYPEWKRVNYYRHKWRMLRLIRSIEFLVLHIEDGDTEDGEISEKDKIPNILIAKWVSTYTNIRSLSLHAYFPSARTFLQEFKGPKIDHIEISLRACEYYRAFYEDFNYSIKQDEFSAFILNPVVLKSRMISIECHEFPKLWQALLPSGAEMMYLYNFREEEDACDILIQLLECGIPSQHPQASMLYKQKLEEGIVENGYVFSIICQAINGRKRHSRDDLSVLGEVITRKFGNYLTLDSDLIYQLKEVFDGGHLINFREVFKTTLMNGKTYVCTIAILNDSGSYELYLFMTLVQTPNAVGDYWKVLSQYKSS